MKTCLHLERKFTSRTETFIVNQINTISGYRILVAAVQHFKHLQCGRELILPDQAKQGLLRGKFLSAGERLSLLAQLESQQLSLIHTHYLVDAWFFLPLTRRFGIPKVVSVYGYDISSFPNKWFGLGKKLLQQVFKEYSAVLAMSGDMKKDLIAAGCPEEKIIVHYYGTDCTRFYQPDRDYAPPNGNIRILTVGSIEEKKAQHLVLEALAGVRREYGFTAFEYHIVGDGPGRNTIQSKIRQLGLENHVTLHGYVNYFADGFTDFYRLSDIFVHPSVTTADGDKEGIPGTIIEAMAAGLPVIATYHAGIPSVIESHTNGILVQERDIQQLTESLYLLMRSKEARETIGSAAARHAMANLDLLPNTRRLEGIYETLMTKGRLPS